MAVVMMVMVAAMVTTAIMGSCDIVMVNNGCPTCFVRSKVSFSCAQNASLMSL